MTKENVAVIVALMKYSAVFMFGMIAALALTQALASLIVVLIFVALTLAACYLVDAMARSNKEKEAK
jgi:hypothetical protein